MRDWFQKTSTVGYCSISFTFAVGWRPNLGEKINRFISQFLAKAFLKPTGEEVVFTSQLLAKAFSKPTGEEIAFTSLHRSTEPGSGRQFQEHLTLSVAGGRRTD